MIRNWVRSVAKRAAPTPVQSSTSLYDLFGSRSAAGMTVTPMESLSVSTVQACVSLIARSLAAVPLVLYRRTADGGREPAEDHPLFPILHDLSNPLQTAFDVRQQLFVSVLLYGNGYAEIEWGEDGYPRALWPLAPDDVQLYQYPDKSLIYRVQEGAGVRWLPQWRVHHVRGLSTAGLLGLSPLRAANAVGLAMATEEFGARFFSQGARPGYILSHPGQLSDKAFQRLAASWNDSAATSHKTKIVEEGIKVEKTGVAPDEAQFLETRAFQVAEICRIFNVSPGLVGAAETQTYASAEQDMIRFRELTLGPWAKNHRSAIERDMLLPGERGAYFVQYKLTALQATDLKTRYEAHQIALLTGFETQNEVRAMEDLNPVEGGDLLWRPLNMGITGAPPDVPDASGDMSGDNDADEQAGENGQRSIVDGQLSTEEAPKNEISALLDAWIGDVRGRLAARVANDVRQQGAKALRNGGRVALQEWGEEQMHGWRLAGESMLAAVPGADAGAVGEWVATAYQRAVRELVEGGNE